MSKVVEVIKYKLKKVAYDLLYSSGLLSHKTHINWDRVLHVKCNESEMQLKFSGLSALYYIETKTVRGYFRTVLPHISYKDCVVKAVDDYYNIFFPEQQIEYESVKETLGNKKAFKKFINMGNIDNPYSRSRRFRLTKDTSLVGIQTPSFLQKGSLEWETYINNIIEMLRYVRIAQARHQRNLRGGKYEFSGVNRQMATEAIAKLLGLDYMIPHSEFVVVLTNGKELKGTLMSIAIGESTNKLKGEEYKSVASPLLQKELTSLNILDTITYERDHRPGNYNMVLDEKGKVKLITVYDNDAAMTFAPFPAFSHSGSGCSAVIKNGFNRPFLDKTLANKIMSLDRNTVKYALRPYLNWAQIVMCWYRIIALKKEITKKSATTDFLLEPNEWSYETMNEELCGRYGRTYLCLFMEYDSISKAFYDYCHIADFNTSF